MGPIARRRCAGKMMGDMSKGVLTSRCKRTNFQGQKLVREINFITEKITIWFSKDRVF